MKRVRWNSAKAAAAVADTAAAAVAAAEIAVAVAAAEIVVAETGEIAVAGTKPPYPKNFKKAVRGIGPPFLCPVAFPGGLDNLSSGRAERRKRSLFNLSRKG